MEKKGRLVVDTGGVEPDAEVMAMIAQAGEDLGYDVVRGEIKSCETCGFFECICQIRKDHKETCTYRKAMESKVSIECQHGFEVCNLCDPCDCD